MSQIRFRQIIKGHLWLICARSTELQLCQHAKPFFLEYSFKVRCLEQIEDRFVLPLDRATPFFLSRRAATAQKDTGHTQTKGEQETLHLTSPFEREKQEILFSVQKEAGRSHGDHDFFKANRFFRKPYRRTASPMSLGFSTCRVFV